MHDALACDGTNDAIDALVVGLLDLDPSGSGIILGDDERDGELELED